MFKGIIFLSGRYSFMELEQKIKTALAHKGLTQTAFAATVIVDDKPMSLTNFNNKLKRNTFSQEELEAIAVALGAKYVCGFEFPDGFKV